MFMLKVLALGKKHKKNIKDKPVSSSMDEVEKSAHKVFKLKYHFVFCVKYRKDLFLVEEYMETFKFVCKGMEERYSMEFETIGFDEDHVHFMLKSLPKYSPSQLFRVVKSVTAIQLFKL